MRQSFKARLAALEALEAAQRNQALLYVIVEEDDSPGDVSDQTKVYLASDEWNPDDA